MLWFSLDDLLLLVLFLVITTIHQGRPFFILPRVQGVKGSGEKPWNQNNLNIWSWYLSKMKINLQKR
jgi:hypothetical protein